MESWGFWVMPLLLLPGVGMLIMSTSVRYNRLHDETHELGHGPAPPSSRVLTVLGRRARWLRDALVGFYLSVGLLALASLTGGASVALGSEARWLAYGLTGAAVMSVLWGAGLLCAEASLSFDVIRSHIARLERPPAPGVRDEPRR